MESEEGGRPGFWSNKRTYAVLGVLGATIPMALLDQFAPGLSRLAKDIIVGSPAIIGVLVLTLLEQWKRKHGDYPDKR